MHSETNASKAPSAANPCLKCTIGQDCCSNLHGLRVSHGEYERTFARWADRLDVRHDGSTVILATHGGGACPNFQGRCTVYETRPMECRLFPHSIGSVIETRHGISVSVHSRTTCPLKSQLISSDEIAHAMVADWARGWVLPGQRVEVFAESGAVRWQLRARRLVQRLLAMFAAYRRSPARQAS